MDVYEAVEQHYNLREFGIDWRDGERTVHEVWRLHPERRFNSYAISSLYIFASQFVPQNATILELGCGTGFGSYTLAGKTKCTEMIGVDLDLGAVSYGQGRFKRPNLTLLQTDIHDASLDYLKGKVDFVYCSNVMEHIGEYEKAVARVYDLLKPLGQYFHVTPPSGDAGGNKYHVTNLKIPKWKKILENNRFYSQRFFSHLNDVSRDMVQCEYDFTFTECGPDDMLPSSGLGSISGIILARKSKNPHEVFAQQAL